MSYYIILLVMTMVGSVASLFLKRATQANGLFRMLKNVNLYLGVGLYLLSALLNIYILKQLDYSVVLPLTSITYIWTMILSGVVLKERITVKKILGVMLILVGAIMVSA